MSQGCALLIFGFKGQGALVIENRFWTITEKLNVDDLVTLTVTFLVRRDESTENYCHSPGVVIVVVVVHRQKL